MKFQNFFRRKLLLTLNLSALTASLVAWNGCKSGINLTRSHSPEFYPTAVSTPGHFLNSNLTPQLQQARGLHTATLIGNQVIFVAGGGTISASASFHELYNIPTGTFDAVLPLTSHLSSLQAVALLPASNLFLFGGSSNSLLGGINDLLEVYDGTGSLLQTQSLGATRIGHTATFIESTGIIRIIGGLFKTSSNNYNWAGNDVIDITVNDFTSHITTSALMDPRYFHTATLGPFKPVTADPSILIVGGIDDFNQLVSGVVQCPTAAQPCQASSAVLNRARALASATLLPNGKVLIAGGVVTDPSNLFLKDTSDIAPLIPSFLHATQTAELFDPSSQSFTDTTGPMHIARAWHTATLLPNGKVLITGGHDNTNGGELAAQTAELYDPITDTFSLTPNSMNDGRFGHTATLLPHGDVILIGGFNASNIALSTTEIFHP